MSDATMSDEEINLYLCKHVMRGVHFEDTEQLGECMLAKKHCYAVMDGVPRAFHSSGGKFTPTTDANHLREVLAKVPEELRERVLRIIDETGWDQKTEWYWFLLTAPPSIVARSIVQAIQQSEVGREP